MAISTGGAVPDGADAVVQIELVVEKTTAWRSRNPSNRGRTCGRRGGDVRAGEIVLASGARIGAAQIGALAAAGVAEVAVARRPRVVVLSTGTERAWASRSARARSTSRMRRCSPRRSRLQARTWSASARFPTTRWSTGWHSSMVLRRTSSSAPAASRSVRTTSSAGSWASSASRRTSGASRSGRENRCLRRPRPDARLRLGQPVSSLGLELFVRPALLALQGAEDPGPSYESARLASPLRGIEPATSSRGRTRDGDGTLLEPLSGQESHMIARAAGADVVFVPAGEGELPAGGRSPTAQLIASRSLSDCRPSRRRSGRLGRRVRVDGYGAYPDGECRERAATASQAKAKRDGDPARSRRRRGRAGTTASRIPVRAGSRMTPGAAAARRSRPGACGELARRVPAAARARRRARGRR